MADDFFKLGVLAARDGNYEKAQAYFFKVVQVNPNSEKGWLYLGHCLSDLRKREYCYQRVLKLNPTNQEAHRVLASLKLKDQINTVQATNSTSPVLAQPDLEPASSNNLKMIEVKKRPFSPFVLIAGVIGSLVFCASVFYVYAISNGFAGQGFFNYPVRMPPIPTASPAIVLTPTLTVTPSPKPSITPTRPPRPTFTPFPKAALLPSIPLDGFTASDPFDSRELNHWNTIIAQDPGNANAYYQRATLYNSSSQTGSADAYISIIDLAIKDIDKAISLRPDDGDYYALRQSIYINRVATEEFEVDREYLIRIALENAYKAYQLGTTIENPERIIIIDLITTNQCETALNELQKLMDKTPKDQSAYGGLLHIQSTAYACLGRLDDALKSVNDSMFNEKNMEYKNELKTQYLIQLERYDEALSVINETFACCGSFGGHRNYWRAEIYYKLGKKDLVQEELNIGMSNTWVRGGMLPYVMAQTALDEGRKEDAIQLLQLAEATFDPNF